MEISEWLEKEKMSLRQFAAKAQIGQSTLYVAYKQKRGLTLEIARKVSKATGGEVSIKEAMRTQKNSFRDSRRRKEVKILCPNCGAEILMQNKIQIHLNMNGTLSSE